MKPFRAQSTSEQLTEYMREELLAGSFGERMPGIKYFVKQYGVNSRAVEAAVQRLENDGLLESQGIGKRRRIVLPKRPVRTSSLRIRILLYEGVDRALPYNMELLARLQEAGFNADFADKTLCDLQMNLKRVVGFVAKTPADAWIVCSGSREILEWLAERTVPIFAMFGRFSGLPIAGTAPRKTPAMVTAVNRLVALGHSRIVMLCREERRQPKPALFEQNFLDELERQKVRTGPYNLPDWQETPRGLRSALRTLFAHTPPTALFIDMPELFHAVQQFLARRGIYAPDKISLICNDPAPTFGWCDPSVAHILWDHKPLVRRVLRWAEHIANREDDRRQQLFDAKFFEGGTIGPVPNSIF